MHMPFCWFCHEAAKNLYLYDLLITCSHYVYELVWNYSEIFVRQVQQFWLLASTQSDQSLRCPHKESLRAVILLVLS